MIKRQDALQFLKEQADNSADILFCDPPYALGSEITIRQDGKPDYSKAVDFMNKWEMPDGKFWEEFYKEVFRVLKFGGHCLMYGMDRQNFMFKYYGHLAGFTGKQSLYWYFISNFPKASDLSKNIDKNAGAEREVIGKSNRHGGGIVGNGTSYEVSPEIPDITAPSTPLAQKYSGYKYSVAPLKQVVEEIMVFQKPMKTGSVLHDTLAMENGDDSITCGGLNIDGNRVESSGDHKRPFVKRLTKNSGEWETKSGICKPFQPTNAEGRYPAQAFLTNTEDILDEQSGVLKSGDIKPYKTVANSEIYGGGKGYWKDGDKITSNWKSDTGGCSKILMKCPYETEEYDLFNYCPKVSKKERNAGCEEMEEKQGGSYQFRQDGSLDGEIPSRRNSHPTVKPISLNEKILRLFKTPNPQKVLIPFAGSGSEIIGAMKAGFEDIQGCEINEEYVKIAEARIKYYENIW